MSHSSHLAGIIPICKKETYFDTHLHDSMMLVEDGYTLLHNAINECLAVGCDTIWIVSQYREIAFIKDVIGEWAYDYHTYKHKISTSNIPKIPIYYVPIKPRDQGIGRATYSWGTIHGTFMAFRIAKGLSKWLTPDNYYVCSPYKVCDIEPLIENKGVFLDSEKPTVVTCEGASVLSSDNLSFTINKLVFNKSRRRVRIDGKQEPADVFDIFREIEHNKVETKWSMNVKSWEDYVNFLSSKKLVDTHSKDLILGKKWNIIEG